MKKSYLAAGLFMFWLTGCQTPTIPNGPSGDDLLNLGGGNDYVDVMTEDADGFVRYPGEPTRESKDYYIVEDICGQFTGKFMEGVTGKTIIKTENPYPDTGIYTCHYTYEGSDSPDLMLVLDYLSADNQKKGQEFLGRTVSEDGSIPMRNMVVYQEDGNINAIYFVLSDNKLLTLNRGAGTKVTNEEMLAIAAKIGQKIGNYK